MSLETLLDRIRVYNQSSIRIVGSDGTVVHVDPYDMREEPRDASFLLITHAHYDHFSPADAALVCCGRTELVAPASMTEEAATLPCRVAHPMRAGERIELPGIVVEAVPAYNVRPDRLGFHPRENGWLGYVVTIDGLRVYVAGDTDQQADNGQVSCDIALVPIGGTYTMDPVEAAAFVNALAPAAAIPTHYGSIVGTMGDYEAFEALVNPVTRVVRKLDR